MVYQYDVQVVQVVQEVRIFIEQENELFLQHFTVQRTFLFEIEFFMII